LPLFPNLFKPRVGETRWYTRSPRFELKRPASLVGIAFLSCLGSFQIGLDAMDYLFSLNNKVRAKDRLFTRFGLVHRCTAATTIQSFKWCHSKTFLITIVVSELSQWQTLVPFVWVVQYTSLEHIHKNMIYPLCLTIDLWMVSRAVNQMHPQRIIHLLPEASDKLGTSIRNDGL
jgi:hypothetical protein